MPMASLSTCHLGFFVLDGNLVKFLSTYKVWVGQVTLDGGDDPLSKQGVEFIGRHHVVTCQQTQQASDISAHLGGATAQVVIQQLTDQTLQKHGQK